MIRLLSHRRAFRYLFCNLIVFALLASLLPSGALRSASAEVNRVDVGFRGPNFGTVFAPTASEMQSKLWFNHGNWWGSLYNEISGQYEIFKFSTTANTWVTTGVLIDKRKVSRADCLWDGTHLYVATAVRLNSDNLDNSIQILRFHFDPSTEQYILDDGFPVLLGSQRTNGVVLDQDTTGSLWATYTSADGIGGSSVYVAHSNAGGLQWSTPGVLPASGASNLLLEDVASLVAYGGQIGLMWSNQNEHAIYFARHRDGDPDSSWEVSAPLQGTLLADNHINLKRAQSPSGERVYAAVKTSLNSQDHADPNAPLVMLLQINQDGTWIQRVFGRVSERHTRPIVLIDEENHELYLFAASLCCGNAKVYYKQISLDNENAQFPPGIGDPILDFGETANVNNVTATKQTVDSDTDILVLAEDSLGTTYVYNRIDLKPKFPPTPGPTDTPAARVMMPIILLNSP